MQDTGLNNSNNVFNPHHPLIKQGCQDPHFITLEAESQKGYTLSGGHTAVMKEPRLEPTQPDSRAGPSPTRHLVHPPSQPGPSS